MGYKHIKHLGKKVEALKADDCRWYHRMYKVRPDHPYLRKRDMAVRDSGEYLDIHFNKDGTVGNGDQCDWRSHSIEGTWTKLPKGGVRVDIHIARQVRVCATYKDISMAAYAIDKIEREWTTELLDAKGEDTYYLRDDETVGALSGPVTILN